VTSYVSADWNEWVQHAAIIFGGRHEWTSLLLGACSISLASEYLFTGKRNAKKRLHPRAPEPSRAAPLQLLPDSCEEEQLVFKDDGDGMAVDSEGQAQHISRIDAELYSSLHSAAKSPSVPPQPGSAEAPLEVDEDSDIEIEAMADPDQDMPPMLIGDEDDTRRRSEPRATIRNLTPSQSENEDERGEESVHASTEMIKLKTGTYNGKIVDATSAYYFPLHSTTKF
jgi:hypothetical protein